VKCSIDGCTNKYRSIGLCSSHWKINKKYGTPTPKCHCGKPSQTFVGNKGASIFCKDHEFQKRFWENVQIKDKDSCWVWVGARTEAGYGLIYFNGALEYSHRLSLKFNGIEIPPRYHACHKCDNPLCVNPSHLYAGSPQNNANDRVERDRHAYGEKHPNSKLSNEDILNMVQLYKNGTWKIDIAKLYSVSPGHVSRILENKIRTTERKRFSDGDGI